MYENLIKCVRDEYPATEWNEIMSCPKRHSKFFVSTEGALAEVDTSGIVRLHCTENYKEELRKLTEFYGEEFRIDRPIAFH